MPEFKALTQSALNYLQANLAGNSEAETTVFQLVSFSGNQDESDVASTVILTEEQINQELSEKVPHQPLPRRSPRLMAKERKVSRSPYGREARVIVLNPAKAPMKARSAKKLTARKGRKGFRPRGKST
ncbi:hypothetical protein DFH28DRAFT_1216352 [Melampsora americana]|nr:hypothetical protein DFH28DRAFT_1216352 [Melampsora americana]